MLLLDSQCMLSACALLAQTIRTMFFSLAYFFYSLIFCLASSGGVS